MGIGTQSGGRDGPWDPGGLGEEDNMTGLMQCRDLRTAVSVKYENRAEC